jgi:hypothetical protein
MTLAEFPYLEINFLTNVPESVNYTEIKQIICIAGGTKKQRENC